MSDVKVFIPEDNKVTDINGEDHKIPKLTWKKELRLIQLVQETMDELTKGAVDAGSSTETLVTAALRLVPDKITEFMSVVMDKDSEWVENSLDSTEIVGVIIPLLKSRFDLIATKIQPFVPQTEEGNQARNLIQKLPKLTQTIQ